MLWRRIVSGVGRGLIAAGVLLLLFVAYQLWGTAWHESRAQRSLRSDFAEALEASGVEDVFAEAEIELAVSVEPEPPVTTTATNTTDRPGTTEPGVTSETTTPQPANSPTQTFLRPLVEFGPPPPPPNDGDAIARLRIPKIKLDKVIVEGVSSEDLKDGPGHYPGTPLPGQPGNAAVAGHRTTYGAPFYDFDQIEIGDLIYVTTVQGAFAYEVIETLIVAPSAIGVLEQTGEDLLTMTTCHPRYTARQRLVVIAQLLGEAAEAAKPTRVQVVTELPAEEVPATTAEATVTTSVTAATSATTIGAPATTAPVATTAPTAEPTLDLDLAVRATSLDIGLSGERAPRTPVILWGLVCAAIWVLAYLGGLWWKKWPAYAIGTPIFLLALFFFFENFSRLVPANL